uniref:Uncharacterized protein n=1 Tax=Oryza glumipatula TaxID=40148 RepID=A0A0E0BRP4_9ORYZ
MIENDLMICIRRHPRLLLPIAPLPRLLTDRASTLPHPHPHLRSALFPAPLPRRHHRRISVAVALPSPIIPFSAARSRRRIFHHRRATVAATGSSAPTAANPSIWRAEQGRGGAPWSCCISCVLRN